MEERYGNSVRKREAEAKRRVVLLNERVGRRGAGLAKKRRTYPRLCKTQRFAVARRIRV